MDRQLCIGVDRLRSLARAGKRAAVDRVQMDPFEPLRQVGQLFFPGWGDHSVKMPLKPALNIAGSLRVPDQINGCHAFTSSYQGRTAPTISLISETPFCSIHLSIPSSTRSGVYGS